MLRFLQCASALLLLVVLTGCASTSSPHDPLEGFNRAMFKFNDTIDKTALQPAATVYRDLTPSFVRTGIGNFFGNLGDIWTAVNNLLQGKVMAGGSDILRVSLNTVLGFGGVLDIASEAGLEKHREDFGQTLGYWGVRSGPYIVLPIFGPSTLRDTVALPIDLSADPWHYKRPVAVRTVGIVVREVDQRAAFLSASKLFEEAALDPYEFTRDAFLQRRESRIRNDSGSSWSAKE